MSSKSLLATLSLGLIFAFCASFDMEFEDVLKDEQAIEDKRNCISNCTPKCPKKLLEEDLGVSCLSSCVAACFPVTDTTKSGSRFQNKLKDRPEFYCLGGTNPEGLSQKQILILFANGPCVPVILAHGVLATRLTISIDCEKFRAAEPKIFERCGWNSCDRSGSVFWSKVPKSEYKLWIPDVMSELSIIGLTDKSGICFASLMKPRFDPQKPVDKMATPREGLVIRVYGFSDGTKLYGECGNRAMENLLPLPLQTKKTEGFRKLNNALIRAGYVPGLTMQSIPYNFYYSYQFNEFKMAFRYNLARLRLYTGKKVTIVAHSMGNLNTLHNLGLMKTSEKKRLIHNWIAIGPPFMGSAKGQKSLIAGSDEFTTLGGMIGFQFVPFITTVTNQMSMYEICAVNPFKDTPKDDPFLQAVQKRKDYETYFPKIDFKDSGFLWLPPLSETCYDSYITFMRTSCEMKLPDFSELPIMKIGAENFSIDQTHELFAKHQLSGNSMLFYERIYNPKLALTYPEVPVILIYTNSIKTGVYYEYEGDFDEIVKREQYPKATRVGNMYGDMTVPTYSAVIPVLRWAHAFDNKRPDDKINHQPVKLVEYCSTYKRDIPVYDDIDSNKPYEIKRNGYIGLECECNEHRKGDNYASCEHAATHTDQYVVDFIISVLDANYRADDTSKAEIERLNEDDLEYNLNECTSIRSGIFV